MTPEQIGSMVTMGGFLFGGGGIVALITALANRKVGLKTVESTTWDSIVDNLQTQLNYLSGKITELENGQKELKQELGNKERMLLRAIAFIGVLELLIPAQVRPKRPEGLE